MISARFILSVQFRPRSESPTGSWSVVDLCGGLPRGNAFQESALRVPPYGRARLKRPVKGS